MPMSLRVEGRSPLSGVYKPSGNANAAQALLAAALLSEASVTLRNMPRTLSTQAMIAIAGGLGASMEWDADALRISSVQITRRTLAQTDTDASVGALLFVAPMLIRRQHVRLEIDFPLNRIRTHLEALRDLGIDVLMGSDAVEFKSTSWDTKDIVLTQASVTATALVMMLATRLGKQTTIHNAACEPHIQELGSLLNAMGAKIDGIGSNVLHIAGVSELGGAEATICPDHIEAASVAAIAALSGGRVQIEGIRMKDMRVIAKIYW
ncbi:MAG: hypothetical protein ABI835_09720, partial [Chloroflexota bacterium]